MASEQDQDSIKDDTPENPNNPIENSISDMVSLQETAETGKDDTPENTIKPIDNEGSMATSQDDMPNTNNKPIENDSGMASLQDSSKDVTPEKPNKPIVGDESDDEDIEDETIGERLWGLTEMFPESFVSGTCCVISSTKTGVKSLYSLSRSVLWIFFTSSAILVAPLLVEVERAQMLETQRSQEKQLLLGSNAMSSNLGPNMAMMPTR